MESIILMSKDEPMCQAGDVWLLGEYTLICCDMNECDLIIERWESFTGQKAKLDGVE